MMIGRSHYYVRCASLKPVMMSTCDPSDVKKNHFENREKYEEENKNHL